jgi:hypothetical protein
VPRRGLARLSTSPTRYPRWKGSVWRCSWCGRAAQRPGVQRRAADRAPRGRRSSACNALVNRFARCRLGLHASSVPCRAPPVKSRRTSPGSERIPLRMTGVRTPTSPTPWSRPNYTPSSGRCSGPASRRVSNNVRRGSGKAAGGRDAAGASAVGEAADTGRETVEDVGADHLVATPPWSRSLDGVDLGSVPRRSVRVGAFGLLGPVEDASPLVSAPATRTRARGVC